MPARHSVSAETLDAVLTHFKLPMGLTLDRVEITGEGIQIDVHPFEMSLRKPGKLEVTVGSGSITSFLNSKAPASVRDFEVSINEERLLVQATAKVIVSVHVTAECFLEIVDEKQLFVRLKSVALGPAVQKLVQNQLDAINPVLDVKDLPVQASLEKVVLTHGHVHVTGSVKGL